MKWYVSIGGPTTVGKTTLLLALAGVGRSDWCKVIPQATWRKPRPDDDSRLIRQFSKQAFHKQQFFVVYGKYGILSDDMRTFVDDPDAIWGLSVHGARTMNQLPRKILFDDCEIKRCNILIRFARSLEAEHDLLKENTLQHFGRDEWHMRFTSNLKLCEQYFYDNRFLDEYVDVLLTREDTLENWMVTLDTVLNVSSVPRKEFTSVAKAIIRSTTVARR